MIARSLHPDPDERCRALEAAILFRDCAQRLRASVPTRAACRRLMRERALVWRRLPAA
jgi:hypothetical protein